MSEHIRVKIQRTNQALTDLPLPSYATSGSAGMDLYAAVEEPLTLPAGDTKLIPTGCSIELPEGFEAQVRPRSGLAIKNRIGILNSPGTIDSDYRGEIKVVLTNFGAESFTIRRGDRIAQLIVQRYARVDWIESEDLSGTLRGEGGFGHTGTSANKENR